SHSPTTRAARESREIRRESNSRHRVVRDFEMSTTTRTFALVFALVFVLAADIPQGDFRWQRVPEHRAPARRPPRDLAAVLAQLRPTTVRRCRRLPTTRRQAPLQRRRPTRFAACGSPRRPTTSRSGAASVAARRTRTGARPRRRSTGCLLVHVTERGPSR